MLMPNIAAIAASSALSGLQSLLGGAKPSDAFAPPSTGQNVPTGAANSSTTTPSATPSSQFSSSLLSTLIAAQSTASRASSTAGKLVSTFDGDSSGSLSLAEVQQALGGGGGAQGANAASATNASAISQAFAKIDTNGDGQLSQSELATALQSLQQDGQASGAHHHHHHHPDVAQASTTAGSGAAATSGASSGGAAVGAGAVSVTA